jgi:superfamily II DNA/RNA helicase
MILNITFKDIGLSESLLSTLEGLGHTTPTPIQQKMIPLVLQGLDVVGCAQTGTGKTGSFTLPLIDILSQGRGRARMPRSLILIPTRELALQVADNFKTYGKNHKLSTAVLIGGESMTEQEKMLNKGADVVIATPGRFLDFYERGKILLSDVKLLVIDEADRMLDMGFIPDIQKIVSALPKNRQTLLLSATMAPEIKKLATTFLQNHKEVMVSAPASTAITIEQFLVHVHGTKINIESKKRQALRCVIHEQAIDTAIIFCNRKTTVNTLVRSLTRHGFTSIGLHGDMTQSKRTESLEEFKAGKIRFLIASDIAARGLDIEDLPYVFNFDVSANEEDYVHRIGRTGRASKKGKAFTLTTKGDEKNLQNILKLIKKPIPYLEGYTPDSAPQDSTPEPKKKEAPVKNEAPVKYDRPKQPEKERPKSSPRDHHERSERPFVGFGAHVPAFMLRAVPVYKNVPESETGNDTDIETEGDAEE